MAREKTVFFCRECGHETSRWQGQCPACAAWNTLVEEKTGGRRSGAAGGTRGPRREAPRPVPLSAVPTEEQERLPSGSRELDRVLGGGFLPGSFLLLSGDPGIGKSTLVLQTAAFLARQLKVLYVSGEESARQIRLRAERLGQAAADFHILTETSFRLIRDTVLNNGYGAVFVDSIQTVFVETLDSAPGSIGQVRESAAAFMQLAKENEIIVFLVGHVTKDGAVAGPRVLEHMVDAVLSFEGDSHHIYRLLRTVKNRFGPAGEIGVFEMRGDGLQEVENPSALFMGDRERPAPGSAVAVTMEGTRPLLLEAQALITAGSYPPRRTVNGMDYHRLLMLLAVLDKRNNVAFQGRDVFVNIAGGLSIDEPAADLAVAAALFSGLRDAAVGPAAFIGEIGLTGEVRGVAHLGARVREAAKFGFKSCVIPRVGRSGLMAEGIKLLPVGDVGDLIELLL
ncbi:MAG: DNA repair protein RadA [Gracilibacteraceae bacterium]|jgi:DNA repair protein RadA/Sms|nr:DNA repair protein RadA [Gracilibacteraceae bacterium]